MEKQKILIADDSEMNRALLVDILEDQYDIVEADNGAAAIDLLTQCGGCLLYTSPSPRDCS